MRALFLSLRNTDEEPLKRSVNIISLNDAHTYTITDGGVDREGNPTSSRQNVQRTLLARTDVDGQMIPIWRVESVGKWTSDDGKRPAVVEGDLAAIHADFDDRYITPHKLDDGSKSKMWQSIRSERVSKSAERRKFAEMEIERRMSGEVASSIMQMVRSLPHAQQAQVKK